MRCLHNSSECQAISKMKTNYKQPMVGNVFILYSQTNIEFTLKHKQKVVIENVEVNLAKIGKQLCIQLKANMTSR